MNRQTEGRGGKKKGKREKCRKREGEGGKGEGGRREREEERGGGRPERWTWHLLLEGNFRVSGQ